MLSNYVCEGVTLGARKTRDQRYKVIFTGKGTQGDSVHASLKLPSRSSVHRGHRELSVDAAINCCFLNLEVYGELLFFSLGA